VWSPPVDLTVVYLNIYNWNTYNHNMERLDQQLARVRSSPGISLLRVSQKGDAT